MREGDADAEEMLYGLVYEQLKKLARSKMRKERNGREHTIQATALVHEAYLRLARNMEKGWRNRGHFLASASTVMHHLLVDYAKARLAAKRGGGQIRVELDDKAAFNIDSPEDFLDLDEALKRFGEMDPRGLKVVRMRYFSGMTEAEIAEVLGMDVKTVQRDWADAKAWLKDELRGRRGPDLSAEGCPQTPANPANSNGKARAAAKR